MKRILEVSLASVLLLPVPILKGVPAQKPLSDLFARGNEDYQKGDYTSAEQCYREVLDAGVDSGPLYYNLGNVCFKQKRLGEAIYFWEKARRKMPGDSDIRENLELANLMVVDTIDEPAEPFPIRVLRRSQDSLSISQAFWTVLLLFVFTNAFFSLYLLVKSPRISFRALVASLVTGTFVLLLGCSLAWRIYDQGHVLEGIVVEQKADVRSGPGADNITVFTVHEGIKVRVRTQTNGWFQVSLPNGWNGWLKATSLRVL